MKRFACQSCSNEVHFDNTLCLSCGHRLGYAPALSTMLALEPEGDGWRSADGSAARYRDCANKAAIDCNWLVDARDGEALCLACRHNHTIPDLGVEGNVARWRAIEAAKRVVFYSLLRWHLPRPTRAEDPEHGLAFDFLADSVAPDGTVIPVMTGHATGLITLNIAEGDDAEREARRTSLGEPYRTLVGHLRHEIGHYYWDVLVDAGGQVEAFRVVFGDERADYGEALRQHYERGGLPGWQDAFISKYAASHPWEDFAESWAHYMHIVDALETAYAYRLALRPPRGAGIAGDMEVDFNPYREGDIDAILAHWVPLTVAMNSLNRSLGQPDLYPFVLSKPAMAKLGFVHRLVAQRAPTAPRP